MKKLKIAIALAIVVPLGGGMIATLVYLISLFAGGVQ